MTPDDLRAWAQHMGYTSYEQAAEALGVSRATYGNWVAGINRHTSRSVEIDRRTALACAALAAGLEPWPPFTPQAATQAAGDA